MFGFNVYWYGVFYFISFLLGYGFLAFLGKQGYFRKFPAVQQTLTTNLETFLMFLLLGVLVGGRLGHVFIYDLGSFIGNWREIFAVWKGGMSFIGGGVGVVVAVLLFRFLYKLSWKEFLVLFDTLLVVIPVGILLGRFGNYLNQELYGISVQVNGFSQFIRPTPVVDVLWKFGLLHIYPNVDGNLRVNTNLLSMLFEGACLFVVNGGVLLCMVKKKYFKI